MADDNIRNSYVLIQGWMITDLDLHGNELLTYALIYGFCQDGKSEFTGSIKYVTDWLGCSRTTAINTLKSLVSKGLIRKNARLENGVTFVNYSTNVSESTVDNVDNSPSRGSTNSVPPVQKGSTNSVRGVQKGSTNSVPPVQKGSTKIGRGSTNSVPNKLININNSSNNTKCNNYINSKLASSEGKLINQTDNLPYETLGSQSITWAEYEALCDECGQMTVDLVIDRIVKNHYWGKLTVANIRDWSMEECNRSVYDRRPGKRGQA